jgi:hypothetical protein
MTPRMLMWLSLVALLFNLMGIAGLLLMMWGEGHQP